MVLVANLVGNHLGPFSKDLDRPKGQEWDVGGPKQKTGLKHHHKQSWKFAP